MCQESLTRHRTGARRDGDVVSREERLDFIRVDRPGVWPVLSGWSADRSLAPGTSMAERSSLSSRSFSSWKSSCMSRLRSSRRETHEHRRTSAKCSSTLRPRARRSTSCSGAAHLDLHDALPGDRLDAVAVRALLNRGRRAREVRQANRPLPARALTWVAARFVTAFVTCASTTRR